MNHGWLTDRRCKQTAFAGSFLVYAAVGYWLQVQHGFIIGDALSRVQSAQSAIESRQPHLAAIGFIFTPLNAIVDLPGILFRGVWPDLVTYGFIASLASALFMAGAVVQILSIGADRGLPRSYVLIITALFAANPMIVFYGSNGMSEAPFIFFLTWTVRRLIMWMVDDDVHHLVTAGFIALSLAYLVRYDSVGAIAAIGFLVAITTYFRAPGPPRVRRALLDLILVSGPGFLAFVGWAVASWLITGGAFAQFSSQYGNAAIFLQSGGTEPATFGTGVLFAVVCITSRRRPGSIRAARSSANPATWRTAASAERMPRRRRRVYRAGRSIAGLVDCRLESTVAGVFQGSVELDIRDSESDWGPFVAPTAPDGAPNVLYLVWDDTGIATWDCFGGLVDMPNMSRIAERGVRLSQFHTTALCSPTRASLLTGRNATTVGMATIEEFTDGFPNCSGRIPRETALISEVLAERGWNTYCLGKWHLTPLEESNLAATKRHWPLNRGFERFYGFMGGETDQWYPDLVYDNHPVTPPGTPEEGYHLSKDLADKAIEFVRDAKVIAPDKPWFCYMCPGAGHAPHHVFAEWADRYAGRFDMGYERYREIVLENQKRLGIVPPDTELSPVNPYADVKGPNGEPWPLQDTVRPWDSLNDEEKRLFARMAEVFAGFLTYTDAQIGRILDYLEESGQLDNTVIVVISDNGASGEGGPNGSVNEVKFFNGYIDTVEESMRFYQELGGPQTYNHYPIGWAMAFNTPYKLFKRYASHEGGIADTAIIFWPKGIATQGEVRDNYISVCDITPTVYELLGIAAPATVRGVPQRPLEGVSFAAALREPGLPTGKDTQFYTMLGTRGIWHDGWFASTVHAASPAGWGNFDKDRWELFHIESDRSQCHDLAAEHPEKLEELKALWFDEAAKYNGLPLADLNILETLGRWRPYLAVDRKRFTYYPHTADVGIGAGVELRGQSFSVLAEVSLEDAAAAGVLYKHGAGHGGHVLYLVDGRLNYIYNFMGEEEQQVSSAQPIPPGNHVLGCRYDRTGTVEGSHTPLGEITLYVDETLVARRAGMRTHPGSFGLAGGGISVGRNTGQPVSTSYRAPFAFTGGTIAQVVVDVSGTPYIDTERELAAAFARD